MEHGHGAGADQLPRYFASARQVAELLDMPYGVVVQLGKREDVKGCYFGGGFKFYVPALGDLVAKLADERAKLT